MSKRIQGGFIKLYPVVPVNGLEVKFLTENDEERVNFIVENVAGERCLIAGFDLKERILVLYQAIDDTFFDGFCRLDKNSCIVTRPEQ